jgi:hypothetical protein
VLKIVEKIKMSLILAPSECCDRAEHMRIRRFNVFFSYKIFYMCKKDIEVLFKEQTLSVQVRNV